MIWYPRHGSSRYHSCDSLLTSGVTWRCSLARGGVWRQTTDCLIHRSLIIRGRQLLRNNHGQNVHTLMPVTNQYNAKAPDTRSRNRLQKSAPEIRRQILAPVFRADARLLTSLTAFGPVRRHEKLAPESGVEFRLMAPMSGAGFWSVCQGPSSVGLTV